MSLPINFNAIFLQHLSWPPHKAESFLHGASAVLCCCISSTVSSSVWNVLVSQLPPEDKHHHDREFPHLGRLELEREWIFNKGRLCLVKETFVKALKRHTLTSESASYPKMWKERELKERIHTWDCTSLWSMMLEVMHLKVSLGNQWERERLRLIELIK